MIRRRKEIARSAPPVRSSAPKPRRTTPRRGRRRDPLYLDWAATEPCCISGERDESITTHHVRFCGSPKDDTRIIRLAPRFHMKTHAGFMPCIEDGKQAFERFYDISIETEIRKLRELYMRER